MRSMTSRLDAAVLEPADGAALHDDVGEFHVASSRAVGMVARRRSCLHAAGHFASWASTAHDRPDYRRRIAAATVADARGEGDGSPSRVIVAPSRRHGPRRLVMCGDPEAAQDAVAAAWPSPGAGSPTLRDPAQASAVARGDRRQRGPPAAPSSAAPPGGRDHGRRYQPRSPTLRPVRRSSTSPRRSPASSPDDRALLALRYVAGLDSTGVAAPWGCPHRVSAAASPASSSACGRSSTMPETTFESVLAQTQIRSLAEGGVRPVDRYARPKPPPGGEPRPWGIGGRWQLPRGLGRLAAHGSTLLLSWCSRCSLPRSCSAWVPAARPSFPRFRPRRTLRHRRPRRRRHRRAVTRPAGSRTSRSSCARARTSSGRSTSSPSTPPARSTSSCLGPALVEGGGAYQPYGALGRDGWLSVDVSDRGVRPPRNLDACRPT